ncbi:Nhp10p KNAG_0K01480 [Huiozyma naganishii CBS 8797]|uniref:HMG box domain-containing protein n=1 Tax=Huiozyma naganishii (strain ATCC MYA-139 / BCRC 22969 / CBS 8797 / KCTC 17520 / NBRC 10181 / NCYC 3082 / Yp74L-3) TaxID=1071383 RepID=J7SA83_HUIN7|nr:hypothetical protein KNAG_0K01480 [Kazachstania naganishii CBS 8797]CCK72509.1 hypothetical protein KNAG_0K01480 [Kazachstania naganishii CBS 8797]
MSGDNWHSKIEELKEKNEVLGLTLQRSRHSVKRLKLEYAVLLERLEQRVAINPELKADQPLPTLEDFKDELLARPFKRTKTKRQKAKERDPNLPKRPTNAYLLYCEMNKDKIRENGSLDVTKDLTEGWKGLSEEQRAPYYKLYNEDRERYHLEMEQYAKSLGTTQGGHSTNGEGSTPVKVKQEKLTDGQGEDDDDDDDDEEDDDDDDEEEEEEDDDDDEDDDQTNIMSGPVSSDEKDTS